MAVVAAPAVTPLSPWPTTDAALAKAMTELQRLIDGKEPDVDRDDMGRRTTAYSDDELLLINLASTVAARIEGYAPGAPQRSKNEALIRATAWLRDTRGAKRVSQVGRIEMEPQPVDSQGWFRRSGAQAVIAPWRVRRAGVVEAEAD